MLIFYKERLAFLSVPKTGTTAYETALRDRADMVISEPAMLKHAPVYRYNRFLRPMFTNVCDVELELLAVMRAPIRWLGRWWRSRPSPFLKGKPNSTQGISFDDFVLAYLKGKKPGFADVGAQSKFMETQPNGTGITHLFKYEDQAKLQQFLTDRLNVTFDLKQENVSPTIAQTLSADVEARFRRKCTAEFELYESIQ